MSFVDSLHGPGESERIEYTIKRYTQSIINSIHSQAQNNARSNKNHISGYIYEHGVMPYNYDALGGNHSEETFAPSDFKLVFSDLEGRSFNANDTVFLTKSMIDERILKQVEKQLVTDGFHGIILRCDSIQGYDLSLHIGAFRKKYIKQYTGDTRLYIYVEVTW